MGSLCSKPGTHSGGHTLVDPGAPPSASASRPPNTSSGRPVAAPSRHGRGSSKGQPLGSSGSPPDKDPRAAAAEAAEQRLKAAQARGTNASNPNRGRLAAQSEANAKTSKLPDPKQEERLVWD